tara:strand:+ start:214 stop:732 length:519 start_codon:yes stop_codon:yes gene_type:complete
MHQVWTIKVSNDVYKFDRKSLQYLVKEGLKQEFYDYKILHISYPSNEIIDFNKSEFFIDFRINYLNNLSVEGISKSYFLNLKDKIVKINSNEDFEVFFLDLKSEKKIIVPKKIVFNLSRNKNEIFRFFSSINNLSGYYVTENLKNKTKKEGFTGLNFKPIEDILPNVEIEII